MARDERAGQGSWQRTYYHEDHLGSTRALSAIDSGTLFYEPFGSLVHEVGATEEHTHRFTGKPLDGTGLYYYGARFYDPGLGRFISIDPARDGLNWYAYCYNNPLKYVDPDGQIPLLVVTGGIGALVGGSIEAYRSYRDGGSVNWGRVTKGAAIGGVAGATLGAGASLVASSTLGVTSIAHTYGATLAGIKMMMPNSSIVIGHYPEYVEMARQLKAKIFNIPADIWMKMSSAEQWATNKLFIDKAIASRSEFILATPYDQIKVGSWLAMEVAYLLEHGYKWAECMTKLIVE